jgi:hypothetical protein
MGLVEQPHGDQHQAATVGLPRERPERLELRQQHGRTDDRTGNEVREERDAREKPERVLTPVQRPAIDVDRVAHALERVERDSDRKRNIDEGRRRRDAHEVHQAVCGTEEEIDVLEEAQ